MPLERLKVALDAAAVGLWDWDIASDDLWWSDNLAEIHGRSPEEFDGTFQRFREFIHPADLGRFDATLAAALADGDEFAVEFRVPGRDRALRWVRGQGRVFRDDTGRAIRVIGIGLDVTSRHREEERQRLLAEAGSVLNASLDAGETLRAVANLAITHLADWCTVHLVREDGGVEQVVVAHQDASKVRWAEELQRRYPYDPDAPSGVPNVLRTGQPELYEEITESLIAAATDDPELIEILHSVGLSSVLIVPMTARGATIGAISLFSAESGRRYAGEDLDFAVELARRCALAIDNAMLFARVHAAERQLRLVADNLPALVSYVDPERRYRFVNRRYTEWFGVPGASLIGQAVPDLLTDHPDLLRENLRRALAGEAVSYDAEVDYPVVGRRHVEIEYVPDIASDGAVRGTVALIVDMTERERQQRRVAKLNDLTASLAGALTEDEVAECIVLHGVTAVGGCAGAVLSADGGDGLTIRATRGFPEQYGIGRRFPVEPVSEFARLHAEHRPYLIETWEERVRQLPEYRDIAGPDQRGAFVALPLAVEQRALGTFAVAFAEDRAFRHDDIDFMMALANVCAQAFDRARLYDAERQARAEAEAERVRVAFLADASRVLADSLDIETLLRRVMELAVGELADWCTTHVFAEGGALRRLGTVHRDPARAASARALDVEYAVLPESCWSSVRLKLAHGEAWFDPAVDPGRVEREAVDPRHAELLRALGFGGELVVPLFAGGRLFGSMTFARSPESPAFTAADLGVAEELAGRTALAMENARLFQDAQASEARYRSLFEGVADAILIVDPCGMIQGGNAAAADLFGVESGGLSGLRLAEVVLDPGVAGHLLDDRWSGEIELLLPGGATVPVDARSTVVELPTGRAALVALRDASQRRALERLQRDFLAMVTHDLRSPLAAIRVHSQLMRRRSTYSEEGVEAIISQTERIARLINALADLVRMDSGRLDLNRQPVDLVALARSVADQESANAPGREIEIVSEGSVVGEWDADRLSQVLANLIGNALKYGGDRAPVVVSVDAWDGLARVAVSDAGDGVPEEHVPKLFERFYRADVTGAGGLGLGLYIARMLTEAHGGTIGVESTVGKGSTFSVVLPRHQS